MGWYFLQAVVAIIGGFSTALWYEPGGPVSVGDATIVAAGCGWLLAWLVTTGLNGLIDRRKRSASAGPERVAGRGDPLIK